MENPKKLDLCINEIKFLPQFLVNGVITCLFVRRFGNISGFPGSWILSHMVLEKSRNFWTQKVCEPCFCSVSIRDNFVLNFTGKIPEVWATTFTSVPVTHCFLFSAGVG